MVLPFSAVLLATTLMLQSSQAAQSQATPPPPQAPPAAGTAAGAAPAQQSEQPPAKPGPPSSRRGRPSKRDPGSSGRGMFEEPRASRESGPTTQQLGAGVNVNGGYDDNLTAGYGTGSGAAPTAMASGTTWSMDGALNYARGNRRHSLGLNGAGSLVAYPGYLETPAAGAVAAVDVRTTVGRDLVLAASERVGYEPFFSVYSPGANGVPLPGAPQALTDTGLFERRSVNSSSSLSLDYRWTRSDATRLSYSYDVRTFTTDDYGDSRSHGVGGEYRRRLGDGVRAAVNYRYRNLEYTDSLDDSRPTIEHRIEVGPEIEKPLSRRSQLSFSLTAGAAWVEAISSVTRQPYSDWVPSGRLSLKYSSSQRWQLEGGFRRDSSLLYGATDDLYTTDTAYVRTARVLTERSSLQVGATYGTWQTMIASGVDDTLRIYGASAQFQVRVSAMVSTTASYGYYYHRYSNPGALPEGFPAEYDRHSVRVGVSLRFPLVGAPSPSRLELR